MTLLQEIRPTLKNCWFAVNQPRKLEVGRSVGFFFFSLIVEVGWSEGFFFFNYCIIEEIFFFFFFFFLF